MVDRSAVVAVDIDLRIVSLADSDAHGLVFLISLLPHHCLLFPAWALCLVPGVVVKESELEVILHNLATLKRRGGSGLSQSWTAV
jgi:hypothetical protein